MVSRVGLMARERARPGADGGEGRENRRVRSSDADGESPIATLWRDAIVVPELAGCWEIVEEDDNGQIGAFIR